MHPSAQRWSDMAKQPNTGLADDLNAEGSAKDGLSVDDLNAGDNTQVKQPLSKTDDAESSVDDDGGDEKSEDTESQEYVVLKGNCIRHDGEMYRENMRIPVTGKDAERLLSPLHDVFGDEHEYRPRNGTPFTINGIFDRGYAQVAENLDGDSEINTSSPMLGVRDAEFRKLGKSQPAVSDRVFIKTVGGHIINQLFVVSNVEPDSHGGSRLVLNVVKPR